MKSDQEWNPPVSISQTITKVDLEHRHSGHEALMSGGANACPICQAIEIHRLQSRAAELEASSNPRAFLYTQNPGFALRGVFLPVSPVIRASPLDLPVWPP